MSLGMTIRAILAISAGLISATAGAQLLPGSLPLPNVGRPSTESAAACRTVWTERAKGWSAAPTRLRTFAWFAFAISSAPIPTSSK